MGKKENENIEGIGSAPENMVVQKSTPLLALWKSELTLQEFKLMDTYLARINSHDPEHRVVEFDKAELENLLDVKAINTKKLKERLKHLMGNTVEISDPADPEQYKIVTLFEEAHVYKDKQGKLRIKLECTTKAQKYFFNVEYLCYLRYKLRCVTSLNSRYAYILFLYLERNRFRKSWEIPVDRLKEMLSCDKEDTYKEYKYFNNLLLKKIKKEINDKTDCKFDYEPVKRGRYVVKIRFTIETLEKDIIPLTDMPGQMTLSEYAHGKDYLWAVAVEDFKFTNKELDELNEMIVALPEHILPVLDVDSDVSLRRYHYIRIKAAEIQRRDGKEPIKSKIGYLKKVIEKDLMKSTKSKEEQKPTKEDIHYMTQEDKEYPDGTELWKQVLREYHFSDAQLEELWTHYCQIPRSELPEDPIIPDNTVLQAFHYFRNIVSDLKVRSQNGEIKNTYRYLLAVVKADAGATHTSD